MHNPRVIQRILLLAALSIPFASAIAADGSSQLSYLGSTLWTGARDVVVDDSIAYGAFGCGLMVFNVANPQDIQVLHQLYLQSSGYALALRDDYIYIAAGEDGIIICNISDPAHPVEAGRLDTPDSALDIFLQDDYAFVADDDSGITIVDISNPLALSLVNTFDTPGRATRLEVRDTVIYLADTYRFRIINISDVHNPIFLWESPYDVSISDLCVVDSVAYTTGGYIIFYDISNPDAPVVLYNHNNYKSGYSVFKHIIVNDNIAYYYGECPGWFGGWKGGFWTMDVTDPTAPDSLAENLSLKWPSGACILGTSLFIADQAGGLEIFDIADPNQPVSLGRHDAPITLRGVSVEDGRLCAADEWRGLWTVITDGAGNFEVAGNHYLDPYCYEIHRVEMKDDYAYFSGYNISTFDISDMYSPTFLASYSSGPGSCLTIRDSLLFIGTSYHQNLQIWSASMVQLSSYPTQGPTTDVAVSGDYAYVTEGGLLMLDISDPTAPDSVAYYQAPLQTQGIAVRDTLAYVCTGNCLYIVNMADKQTLAVVGQYPGLYGTRDVLLSADKVYVAAGNNGLIVIDVSDPTNPVLYDSHNTPGYAENLALHGITIYIADHSSIIALNDPNLYFCGDANDDGNANVGDAVFLIGHVFRGGSAPRIHDSGDANCDWNVNVGDVVYLINYVFRDGSAPCCP